MSSEINQLYEFGEFRIDRRKGLLFRREEPVALPPKAFETLIAFAESDGRVLSKEELMTRVWGADTFVEENNLTQQISALRKLLGAPAIETVPRRGYRFALQATPPQIRRPKRPPLHRLAFLSVLVVLSVLSVLFVLVLSRSRTPMPRTIAVLPFKPLVQGSSDPYLELGMADALITELSNVHQMTVRPTSSVIMYTAASDPSAIGETLGVEAVLDGRIQHIGDRVRVTAQLVRVRDRKPLWAGKFDEDAKNILAMQDAISNRIVSALMLDLSGDEKRTLGKRATQNQEAYQLYLRPLSLVSVDAGRMDARAGLLRTGRGEGSEFRAGVDRTRRRHRRAALVSASERRRSARACRGGARAGAR